MNSEDNYVFSSHAAKYLLWSYSS